MLFISYSRSDAAFMKEVVATLCGAGLRAWSDVTSIDATSLWDRAIEQAIRDADAVVGILTPRAVASENVGDELSYAREMGKPIILLERETCDVPLRMRRLQRIDATGGEHWKQELLETVAGGKPAAARPRKAPTTTAIKSIEIRCLNCGAPFQSQTMFIADIRMFQGGMVRFNEECPSCGRETPASINSARITLVDGSIYRDFQD